MPQRARPTPPRKHRNRQKPAKHKPSNQSPPSPPNWPKPLRKPNPVMSTPRPALPRLTKRAKARPRTSTRLSPGSLRPPTLATPTPCTASAASMPPAQEWKRTTSKPSAGTSAVQEPATPTPCTASARPMSTAPASAKTFSRPSIGTTKQHSAATKPPKRLLNASAKASTADPTSLTHVTVAGVPPSFALFWQGWDRNLNPGPSWMPQVRGALFGMGSYFGYSHPKTPAVNSPYINPSTTSL